MTPSIMHELAAIEVDLRLAGATLSPADAPRLAARLAQVRHVLEQMTVRPVADLVPLRPGGKPALRVIEGGAS